ncbi:Fur family transcriptional regulator [Actinomadura harenae]|uniref:Transcriptional repressor n=1 Tax=Actinomadura harenae TaxID=2483351 RepID=A0A3M2M5F3_9ACTN|nr:Fur family transcriptional regulator [Actinomadura harenae]RMI44917.1 transcriptional repressor [Actinomadura harenae]
MSPLGPDPGTAAQHLSERLRRASLRVTKQRVAVLRVLEQHPHADAGFIICAVRERFGAISVQAAYDVLAALDTAGLVRRVELAGPPARYELRMENDHHHAVCRACGVIADIACATGDGSCLTPSAVHGFTITEVEVTYWGLCPSCTTT